MVEWPFILTMLKAFRFDTMFIKATKTLFSKAITYFLLNKTNMRKYTFLSPTTKDAVWL